MNDRLKEAFDAVHAEEELKNRTEEFLLRKIADHSPKRNFHRAVVSSVACLALIFGTLFGYWLYFTPTSMISIDVNPSFELEVNRFNRVISVNGYNEDGQVLAKELNLRFTNYEDAVNEILAQESIASYLQKDGFLSIVVTGEDEKQSDEILENVKACTEGHENVFCTEANFEEVSAAHEAGLSFGKYRMFLELQQLDPEITPEEVQGMTMREIRDWIDSLSGEETTQGNSGGMGYGNQNETPGHGRNHHWE